MCDGSSLGGLSGCGRQGGGKGGRGLRSSEGFQGVAHSHGRQIRAGCWQEASVLYKTDIFIRLLDRANDMRESKMEAALSYDPAYEVTLHHFLSILPVAQVSPVQHEQGSTRT